MERFIRFGVTLLFALAVSTFALSGTPAQAPPDEQPELVQASAVLTVSESKRLIGKAVARMPIVKQALEEGMVIITTGTTNTYVAEEILGEKVEHGAFVTGKVYPAKGAKRLKPSKRIRPLVLKKGKLIEGLSLEDACKELGAGDVVIKGANALDYKNKTAAVLIGHPSSGTIGTVMPYVVARKAHLVIPVGLEKLVAGDLVDIASKMRAPVKSLARVPSMFLVTGDIVTELEALKLLANVEPFHAASGGIGGAEGAVRLVFRGKKENVEKAQQIIRSIQGEPPFVE